MSDLTNHQAARVIADVARSYEVTPAAITGRDKSRVACAARREVWSRIRAMGCSYENAGFATGHHYTTVMSALRAPKPA